MNDGGEPVGGVGAGGGVELAFAPVAGHVRTARLVVASVGRHAGFDETRLDELRLATGEACARAVRRCRISGVRTPVLVRVADSGPAFVVEVVDAAGPGGRDGPGEDPVVVALLSGLADDAEITSGPGGGGGRVRLRWLLGGHRPPPDESPDAG